MNCTRTIHFGALGVLMSLAAIPAFANDSGMNLGGFDGTCMSKPRGTWCLSQAQGYEWVGKTLDGKSITAHVLVNYKYETEQGSSSPITFSIDVLLDDPENAYELEAALPFLVHVQANGYHRDLMPLRSQSIAGLLTRIPNQRQLKGYFTFSLTDNFGAEYVELLRGIDLSFPGSSQWMPVGYDPTH